jgi:hypothetical protein
MSPSAFRRSILRAGYDLSDYGQYPLHKAVKDGNLKLVQLMLVKPHPADPNTATGDGVTPLMIAVQQRRLDIAALLLEHGADANATDFAACTALDRAGRLRDDSMTRLLRGHGAR